MFLLCHCGVLCVTEKKIHESILDGLNHYKMWKTFKRVSKLSECTVYSHIWNFTSLNSNKGRWSPVWSTAQWNQYGAQHGNAHHFVKQALLGSCPYLGTSWREEFELTALWNLWSLVRPSASPTNPGRCTGHVCVWLWPNWGTPVPKRGTYTPQTHPPHPPHPTPRPESPHSSFSIPSHWANTDSGNYIIPPAQRRLSERTVTSLRCWWGLCGVMFKDKHYLNCFSNPALIKDWFTLDMPDGVN